MLEQAKPFLGFDFDQTISVEEAGYFKPHFATYHKAAELIGEDRSRIMHIANHAFDGIVSKSISEPVDRLTLFRESSAHLFARMLYVTNR